jgi:hypothetical protein
MLAATPLFDVPRRREMFASGIATQTRLRRQRIAALSMMQWSVFELTCGDPIRAKDVTSQTVEMCRRIEPTMHVRSLGMLWRAFYQAGDIEQARATAMIQLELGAAIQKPTECRNAVTALVALQERIADPALHAKLLGYAGSKLQKLFGPVTKISETLREGAIARVQAVLGAAAYEANAAEGAAWDEATAYTEALKLEQSTAGESGLGP